MSPSIFITGTTGYLGGTTLKLLHEIYPQASYTALVRTKEQADAISSAYPSVKPILGDISNAEVVTPAAANADVVLDIAGDNEAGLKAIVTGLASRKTPSEGALIHVSGVTCLLDMANLNLGHPAERIFSDVTNYSELISLPVEREHIVQDRVVMNATEETGVKTVILSSCQIMGNGAGPWKKETYGHWYVKTVLGRGKGFMVEKGENVWSWCSVSDVASAIVFTLGKVLDKSPDLKYGKDGYYFVQTGESSFAEQAAVIASKLKNLEKLTDQEVDALTIAQATEIHPYAGLLWGASCRCRADRLKEIGWKPKQTDWRSLMEETVVAAVA